MENTHKRIVKPVTRLGIKAITDARFTNSGNAVVYTRGEPDKSMRVSVTNALRGKTNQVMWKSASGSHKVFGVTRLSQRA